MVSTLLVAAVVTYTGKLTRNVFKKEKICYGMVYYSTVCFQTRVLLQFVFRFSQLSEIALGKLVFT